MDSKLAEYRARKRREEFIQSSKCKLLSFFNGKKYKMEDTQIKVCKAENTALNPILQIDYPTLQLL